jgi:hypothetical protein
VHRKGPAADGVCVWGGWGRAVGRGVGVACSGASTIMPKAVSKSRPRQFLPSTLRGGGGEITEGSVRVRVRGPGVAISKEVRAS